MAFAPLFRLLLTCEHATNSIPRRYRWAFKAARAALRSHRGWDPGALRLARFLQAQLDAPLFFTRVSRLLVETNRSRHHPRLFSEYAQALPSIERESILAKYYEPHRKMVEDWIRSQTARGEAVCHIGVHSFTPQMNGVTRRCDIGLLYDPRRRWERRFCRQWQASLRQLNSGWRVRLNYPYRGAADGLTTSLRSQFGARQYLGIELEFNQRLLENAATTRRLWSDLTVTLGRIVFGQ